MPEFLWQREFSAGVIALPEPFSVCGVHIPGILDMAPTPRLNRIIRRVSYQITDSYRTGGHQQKPAGLKGEICFAHVPGYGTIFLNASSSLKGTG